MVPDLIGDAGLGGVRGLAPAPAAGDAAAGKFLSADGAWEVPGVVVSGAGNLVFATPDGSAGSAVASSAG